MNRRYSLFLLLLFFLPGRAISQEKPPAQWLVVTAPAFRSVIEPLCEHRKTEGMKVQVVQTTDVLSPQEILNCDSQRLAEHVRRLCREWQGTSYVLLVGAIEAGNLTEPEKKVLPVLLGSISRMRGQPSDNGYGCLDGDRLPTVAVGRLPARSEDEARAMVHKILAFERDTLPGEWRQRITVLAGVPAFNPLVDRLVEGMAMSRLAMLDAHWTGRAIYHNPSSRFCVPDGDLHDRALQYVQDGQMFTFYFGHSWAPGLFAPQCRFLDRQDWAELKIPRGAGVFATFGCNGCQLSGPGGEGYGVAAMRNPHGPVAVIGSHGISFAAMGQLAADGVLECLSAARPPERLAEFWLKLKQGIAKGKMDEITFRLLDAVDGNGKIPQATQRQEHLEMYVLLGDPALRLPGLPEPVDLEATGIVEAKSSIVIRGEISERFNGAKIRLTLERPLTGAPVGLQPLPAMPGEERNRVMLVNHLRANEFIVADRTVSVHQGKFDALMHLPDEMPWPTLVLRAYVARNQLEAFGVMPLNVKK
jgi:hypothetical protein